ncbi:DRC3 protein, partial [Alectura lathami]|nr:DRC3 protein [Alectura lathami]
MSQLYNSIEPTVIDDDMLQRAVEEQWPEDVWKVARTEGISFKDVTEIQLSFRNILQIDNLWQLENLTKLQLDNNVIEKIEALESLVHLVWLDLSFNNIEVIEGLDTLVKLQDLSLSSNRISKIEHMDTLQELQIFSIGKNQLTALENVVYLRRFKSLRTLNLAGNPFCDEEQYALFVVAHLPGLVYLDFKLVSDTTVSIAAAPSRGIGQEFCANQQLCVGEGLVDTAAETLRPFVEYLNGSFLFDSLYAEDTEAARLAYLPGVDDLLQAYPSWVRDFVSVCENLFNYGLKEHEKREAEVSDFYEGLHEALAANQEEGKKIILDFEHRNRTRLDEIHHASSRHAAESLRAEYNEDILQLSETLMALEMQVADQLEELIKEFERNVADMASAFIENVKERYPLTQCRDLENRHHEKLLEISIQTLEKSLKNELDEDLPDDVRELLVDKSTIVNVVNKSHNIHLLKISLRESDILTSTYRW